jgi:hypothetical protein
MMEFLENKYTKWYFNIISSAQKRIGTIGYFEKHHVIPKSLGGSNSKDNLVKLTAREHFICHRLLTKMVENTRHKYQMWNAFSCMLYRNNKHQERYKVNSKIFEKIKREGSKIKSEKFSGKNNPMFGKTHSSDAIEKIKKVHIGKNPSEETRNKLRENMLGKRKSEEHKLALKNSWKKNRKMRSGENHPRYGKLLSDSVKEKIRLSVLNMPSIICENCGKNFKKGAYRRWHGDKCKLFQGELKFLA